MSVTTRQQQAPTLGVSRAAFAFVLGGWQQEEP
jgi:hypothetical protein